MRTRPFLIVVGMLVALHIYIGWRLLPDLPIGSVARSGAVAWLGLSCVFIPASVTLRSLRRSVGSDVIAWIGLMMMGFFSSLMVLTFLRDIVLLLGAWPLSDDHVSLLVHISAVAVAILAVLVTLIGFMNARRRAGVVNVDVPLDNLPAALHGFSIAQISDIHVGPTIKRRYLDAIVDAVNQLNADVIAVTGDLVDGCVQQLASHVAPLARLSARHGTYFVTGNHEYYSGERGWTQELRRLGVKVLKNEHVVLIHAGKTVVLAGVTDYSAQHFDPQQRSDPQAALHGAPAQGSPKILLAHQPRSAPAAAAAGFDLQLSGHTHGGQFWPWNLFVRCQQPFTAGLHRLGDLWVYTSRGTGYWGPPKRFGAPSEITYIRLVPATS